MAQAQSDPLAPGAYSIDIFRPFGSSSATDQDPIFQDWIAASLGAAKVTQRTTSTTVIPGTAADGTNTDRVSVHYTFEVLGAPEPSPAAFPRASIGSPDIIKLGTSLNPGDLNPAVPDDQTDTTAPSWSPGASIQTGLQNMLKELEKVPPLVLVGLGIYFLANSASSSGRRSRAW